MHHVRQRIVDILQAELQEYEMTYALGGQVSIDLYPIGWDKTLSLEYVRPNYEKIYFFGDKVEKGGNDYEIYNTSGLSAHAVINFNDTMRKVHSIFAF